MKNHLYRLGVIYIVLGWLGIAFTIVVGFLTIQNVQRLQAGTDVVDVGPLPFWIAFLVLISLAVSLFYFAFGKALQQNKRWATRFIGFIVGFLILFSFPLGTAVGAYTLWVLIKIDTKETMKTEPQN